MVQLKNEDKEIFNKTDENERNENKRNENEIKIN